MQQLKILGAAALAITSLAVGACSSAPARHGHRKPQPVPPLAKAVIRTAKSYFPEEEKHHRTPQDCSDFVRTVFSAHNVDLPRTAAEMSILGNRIASSRDLRMGDLVFFSGNKANRIVGHVGIYVNNGVFIHFSQPEVGVTMESLYSDYYRRRYLTARRVIR